MRNCHKLLSVLGLLAALTACSMHVPVEKVYGTYVASYPYGAETMIFNPDHTFIQSVTVRNGKPIIARGHWEFEPKESRVSFTRAMIIDDGFGGLRPDWQRIDDGLQSLDVEMLWFHIEIGSGLPHPYMKQ